MSEPRRIYTRIVIDMTQDDLPTIESESYLYDGPMALCVDGRGDAGNNNGRGDSESGNGSSGRGGSSGGGSEGGVGNRTASRGGMAAENARGGLGQTSSNNSGGNRSFGSADAAYSRAESVAREAVNRGGGVSLGAPSFGSADAAYSRSVHAGTPDISGELSNLTGRQVTRTDAGYADEMGNAIAGPTGVATGYGAQAVASAQDMGMAFDGAKAISDALSTATARSRSTNARDVQNRVTNALKDPVALGLDPHQAFSAYNDAMHGMYGKAVSVGAMSPDEARDVQKSFGGLSGAFGFGLDDVTTDYEAFVDAVDRGLLNPTTGKPTLKGWMSMAAVPIGMLAAPLSALGLSAFGVPGAVVGALAPAVANAYAQPKSSPALNAATGLASKALGMDMSGFGTALSSLSDINTMGKAQQYAGTAPSHVSGSGIQGFSDGGGGSFLKGYEGFFTAKAAPKQSSAPAVNPRFQQRQTERRAGRAQSSSSVTKPGVIGPEFEASYQPFFRRA